MNNFSRKGLALICILFGFSILSFFAEYKDRSVKTDTDIIKIPLVIGHWQGKELPIPKKLRDKIGTKSVIMREYSDGENLLELTIVYSNRVRESLDLPESWYTSKWSFIAMRENEEIMDSESKYLPYKKIMLIEAKRNQLFLYYFETANMRTPSYTEMRWEMIKNRMKSKPGGAALIRVSAVIKKDKIETAQMLESFIRDTAPTLSKYLD